jgi:hypothetical protein
VLTPESVIKCIIKSVVHVVGYLYSTELINVRKVEQNKTVFFLIIVFFYQLDEKILYLLIHLLHSSTCFEHYYAQPEEVTLY